MIFELMTEERILGFVIGMMLGAVLGGLAPAAVSLYILFLWMLGYYVPVMLEFRDRYLSYSDSVGRMSRQW